MFHSIVAVVKKDLTLNMRKPMFSLISLLVPLLFIIFYALVIHTSSTNPIAIANHSEGPYTERFIDVLQNMQSVDGSYFEIITQDDSAAYQTYDDRRVDAVLDIPKSFENNLRSNEPTALTLTMFNINSDVTKNFQLRVDHAVHAFHNDLTATSQLKIRENATFEKETPMKSYVSTGLLVFSVLLSAMMSTGTLFAREWEERTAKLIVLTPIGLLPFIIGKWTTALIHCFLNVLCVFPLLHLLLDYPMSNIKPLVGLYVLLFFLYGSAVGTLLGLSFKKTLPIVPVSVMIAMSEFLVSGLESYIRGFAHGGLTEWLWRIGDWWPSSNIINIIRFTMEDISNTSVDWVASIHMIIWVGCLLAFSIYKLKHQLSFIQAQ